jgi:hypothetical protein
MRIRRGYEPKPSQTRYGQRVDNPVIDTSATGEVQSLVEQFTQDAWHDQNLRNADFDRRLNGNHRNWSELKELDLPGALQKLAAMRRDLYYHWIAIAGLAFAVFELYRK